MNKKWLDESLWICRENIIFFTVKKRNIEIS